MLRDALKVSEDPFYTELMPDFDWRYYRYRVLDYYVQLTVLFNRRGMKEEDFPEAHASKG